MSVELWFATTNKDKYKEVREMLKALPIAVRGAFELPHYTAPQEIGNTFLENARIKAKFLHAMRPDAWVIADDSGLEVNGLKGLPGVHSARYAGPRARDVENTTKVLTQIRTQNVTDRTCQFKCAMVLVSPSGEEFVSEGMLKGTISTDMRGKTGFGYDPIFIPENETKTIAELGLAVKNRLSHRAQALRGIRTRLEGVLEKPV